MLDQRGSKFIHVGTHGSYLPDFAVLSVATIRVVWNRRRLERAPNPLAKTAIATVPRTRA